MNKCIAVLTKDPDTFGSALEGWFDVEWQLCDSEEAAKKWACSKIESSFNFDERDRLYGMFESEDGGMYCELLPCEDGDKIFSVLDDGTMINYETYRNYNDLERYIKKCQASYEEDWDNELLCWTDQVYTRLKAWRIDNHEEITSMDQLKKSKRESKMSSSRAALRENSRNDKVLFEATENAFDAYSEPFFDHVNRDWFDGLSFDIILNKKDRENGWKGLLQGKIRDIIFIADEAGIDPQEDLIFYDEDGNVIHDAYALLYDTDEVFNESKRTRRPSLRENYQDFNYAYYKTKRIANSLCKEFDTETVKYAFGKVSDEL